MMAIRGDRVRELRKRLGISQDELGSLIGTDQKQISNYENSKGNPTAESLLGLADALHTSADYLLGRTDDPTQAANGLDGQLSRREMKAIQEWRNGNLTEAVKIILNG